MTHRGWLSLTGHVQQRDRRGECFTCLPYSNSTIISWTLYSPHSSLTRSNTTTQTMPPTASIRRSLPQALESLHHGTGASIHLPASVRAVSVTYTYKRAGKNVQYVASPFQIPSSYRSFDPSHHLKPSLTMYLTSRKQRIHLKNRTPSIIRKPTHQPHHLPPSNTVHKIQRLSPPIPRRRERRRDQGAWI
jgi:hypothetical protein